MAVSTISRRPLAAWLALSGLLIVGAGAMAVAGVVMHDGGSGPVLLRFSEQHGLHLGDVLMLIVPLSGVLLMGVGYRLARQPR